MWVHQHRAHVRVLFEKYISQLSEQNAPSQGLLFPERLELSVAESLALDSVSVELSSLGFDISSLGSGSYAINGVPVGLDGLSYTDLLMDLLRSVMEQTRETKESISERIANYMAKQVAIVKGLVLSMDEMKALIDEIGRAHV